MKKLVCLTAALVCVASMAMAEEFVPSKTTMDMNRFEIVAEQESKLVVRPIVNVEEMGAANKAVYEKEIEKLAQAADLETYFANTTDNLGNAVSLKEMLGAETLNVHEMCMLVVENYEAAYGDVAVNMYFSTPYQKDEKVIVMIGLVDGAQSIQWVAYEGVGIAGAAEGGIRVEFDSKMMEAIQNGTALLAVVSR